MLHTYLPHVMTSSTLSCSHRVIRIKRYLSHVMTSSSQETTSSGELLSVARETTERIGSDEVTSSTDAQQVLDACLQNDDCADVNAAFDENKIDQSVNATLTKSEENCQSAGDLEEGKGEGQSDQEAHNAMLRSMWKPRHINLGKHLPGKNIATRS